MPCYCPIPAWRAAPPLRGVTFTPRGSIPGSGLNLPCGRCIGCRLAKAAQWSTRIAHEAALHPISSFLTLTYSDDHLPLNLSVDVRTLQLFIKRYREKIEPVRIRFVACGEYGSKFGRPHYHLIIFGDGFLSDRYPWRKSKSGHTLFRSPMLEGLWPYGNSEIGSVTPESGAYVARYTLKKMFGDSEEAQAAYRRERVDLESGEVVQWTVAREFFVTSRRPGIGAGWLEKFGGDVFPSDYVVLDGKKRAVPQFYRRKLEAAHTDERLSELSDDMLKLKHRRVIEGKERALHPDNTEARLRDRAEYRQLISQRFERDGDE